MPRITTVVLQDDVANAVKSVQAGHHATTHCPIARALCRALGLALGHVSVRDTVEVYDSKDYALLRGIATLKMVRAIRRFDQTRAMKPSIFRIRLEPVP